MTANAPPTTTGVVRRSLLASDSPPAPAGAIAAAMTFAWRSLLKIKHVPEQLADVILIPIMFTLLFTYLFGGALAGSTSAYLQYLLPGTLVMAVVTVTIYSGVTLNTDVTTGVFDRFRSLPIWSAAPLVGGLIGDVGRYLLASGLVIGLGLVLGYQLEAGALAIVPALALILVFAFSLSWAWLALGLRLQTARAVQIVGFVVVVPLTFASNVFVDPETMPSLLRAIVEVNPVSHLVTAVRGLLTGELPTNEIAWTLAASAVLVMVFAPITVHLYRRNE